MSLTQEIKNQGIQKMERDFDVVIVGGGMGGLALALGLAQRGRSVALVEKQPRVIPLERGELLQPNGLKVLNDLMIYERLKTMPSHEALRYHFYRIDHGRLCTIDYRYLPAPWNFTMILRPFFLLREFLNQVQDSGQVTLYLGTEFKKLLWDKGRVSGVTIHHEGHSVDLSSRVVVGSDGVRSKVREEMRIRARVKEYAEAYLTMIVPRPIGFNQDARYYVGCREILGMFPISKEELYLFYMIPGSQRDLIRKGPVETVLARIARIDPSIKDSTSAVTSWSDVGLMPCFRVRTDRWSVRGAVLMGDAAHAMNPHVAQGRNQALEDAWMLTELLSRVFLGGDEMDDALASYEQRRRPPVEVLQRYADEMVFFWNAGLPPITWLRDRVFRQLEYREDLRLKFLGLSSGVSSQPLNLWDRMGAAGFVPR